MKKVLLFFAIFIVIIIVAVLTVYLTYQNNLKPVGTSDELVEVEIVSGSTYSTLASLLYEKHLIRNELAYRIYIKLNPPKAGLKAGTYYLKENMSVSEIVEALAAGGNSVNPDEIRITFKEGLNMRAIASLIASETNRTEEEVFALLKDQDYLKELIQTYWFIDESILDENIYYPLEGYLYPNTYHFKNKDVSVKEIFKVLLDEMGKQLLPYQEEIEKSKYSAHEILTLASVIELEAPTVEYRKGVSGVFYNRLKSNISLGSDVTTYYGAQVDMSERDLYAYEIEAVNGYNTRPTTELGLPVGPICNPSIESVVAALEPDQSDYYYFLADNQGKVYFTKTYQEHIAKREELKSKGLWERY